jgi:hypothetical protein
MKNSSPQCHAGVHTNPQHTNGTLLLTFSLVQECCESLPDDKNTGMLSHAINSMQVYLLQAASNIANIIQPDEVVLQGRGWKDE